MLQISAATLMLLAAGAAAADDAVPDDAPPAEHAAEAASQEDGFGLGALPALNYNSDEGFGYGVIGTGYWYRGGIEPYRTALTVRAFLTTRWVHAHMVRVDALEVKDLPLRITAEAGYNSSLTSNYCGIASESDCDPARAEADAAGLEGETLDDYLRRYYFVTYTEPYALANVRWKLIEAPTKIEVFGGYRGSLYMAGTPSSPVPWQGSFYQTYKYPDGEEGFASVLQAGLMADTRDNEPAPNAGYWVEGSLRGASRFLGSEWDYLGANVTLRYYQTIVKGWKHPDDGPKIRRPNPLVSATRVVGDGTWGDLPTMELVRFGGSSDYEGIGGQYGGRGMRSWRFHGHAKLLAQEELRWTIRTFTPGTQQFDLGLVGFGDFGYAADDWSDLSVGGSGYGVGSGLRVTWNRNFIVRCDVAFSPVEDNAMKMYINLDHIF